MARLLLVTKDGTEFDLTEKKTWFRSVAFGGFTGLVGTKRATTVTAAGVPGQTPVAYQVQPMTGQITLHVYPAPGDDSIGRAVSEIRRALFPDEYATVVLERETVGRLDTRVRLDGPIESPQDFPEDADYAEVRLPLISDVGLWSADPVDGAGSVTVTNVGNDFLWPTLVWKTGGTILLPSGNAFTLPPAEAPAWLSLNPYTAHEVTVNGEVDPALSTATEQMWLGEGVPQRQSRMYEATGDVRVVWRLQYLDPWR